LLNRRFFDWEGKVSQAETKLHHKTDCKNLMRKGYKKAPTSLKNQGSGGFFGGDGGI